MREHEHVLWLLRDESRARKQGIAAIMQRQRTRFNEMVAFARAYSPYYREFYQGLPEKIEDPGRLPVTDKKKLMARFNDWVTDCDVTIEKVCAHIDNPDLIGELYLGKYLVATTSGTTGTRGIFLVDKQALAVTLTFNARAMKNWLSSGDIIKLLARGGRMALVVATDGHFMVAAGNSYLRKANPLWGSATRFFSVHTPLPELVAQLNRFRPAIVMGYGSVITLLAGEQAAGRLRIDPMLLFPGGETLGVDGYERIARLFNAKARDLYGGTECTFATTDCMHRWYHINSDWVMLEPVDADYRPVPPGEQSHTVLLSNLANRIQPILRYDMGDSVLQRPDPCPCGNPMPAIRVQGRAADVLTFHTERRGRSEQVAIAPLMLGTLVDHTPGIEQFQIVQTTPTNLRVRLRTASGANPDSVWQSLHTEITHLLATHHLDHVSVERAEEPPAPSPGGKYRPVIPLGR